MFVALGGFAFLFAPLPGLKRIPIGILRPAFLPFRPMFRAGFRSRFTGRDVARVDVGLRIHFFFELELDFFVTKGFVDFRLVQTQVGTEIIFNRLWARTSLRFRGTGRT